MQRRLLFKRSRDYLFCYSLRCRNERSVLHKLSKTIGYLFEKTRQNYVHEFFFFFYTHENWFLFQFYTHRKWDIFFERQKLTRLRACVNIFTRVEIESFLNLTYTSNSMHIEIAYAFEKLTKLCVRIFFIRTKIGFFSGDFIHVENIEYFSEKQRLTELCARKFFYTQRNRVIFSNFIHSVSSRNRKLSKIVRILFFFIREK